jgi:hypothetical protein
MVLAACEPAPKSAKYTVEAYRHDPALREATLAECANDPGGLRAQPDCLNAQRAAQLESRGSLRAAPAMGLMGGARDERPPASLSR